MLRQNGGLNIAEQKSTKRDKKKWDEEEWDNNKQDKTEKQRMVQNKNK